MGKVTGFKEYAREVPERRSIEVRVNDYFEVYQPFPEESLRTQSARCMAACWKSGGIPAAAVATAAMRSF